MRKHLLLLSVLSVCGLFPALLSGQELLNPFEHPALLSGNFGELRSNHFHAGLDFKTQGTEGKPVRAVNDGYVSRLSVSPSGYGNALYLTHPDGTITVYGHLLRFADSLAAYVKEQQYAEESFSVDLRPEAGRFPVKKGEVVALSGNTGSSGGPHLHFEVRDAGSGELLDPVVYYRRQLRDTRPPRIQSVMIYPVEGEGAVNGKSVRQEYRQKLSAWGKIGIGVKAYDYMDGTHNIYGVKEIVLKTDGDTVFHSRIDRYALDESRYLNSFIDYADWIDNRSFYMKSFIEPGNRLRFLEAKDRGYITIDEERDYLLEYVLTDAFGNAARLEFRIEGKEQPVTAPETEGRELFAWRSENRFGAKGIRLTIPKGNLYDSFYFKYYARKNDRDSGDIHVLHNTPVPLHRNAFLSLRLPDDSPENREQYGIVRINKAGRRTWIGGVYRRGWIDATIRELGQYALACDTVPPTITPVAPFVFRLSDNLSGISTWRGEIDGKYVLFESDNRSVITYRPDKECMQPGAPHTLRLTVRDACGNETVYEE